MQFPASLVELIATLPVTSPSGISAPHTPPTTECGAILSQDGPARLDGAETGGILTPKRAPQGVSSTRPGTNHDDRTSTDPVPAHSGQGRNSRRTGPPQRTAAARVSARDRMYFDPVPAHEWHPVDGIDSVMRHTLGAKRAGNLENPSGVHCPIRVRLMACAA